MVIPTFSEHRIDELTQFSKLREDPKLRRITNRTLSSRVAEKQKIRNDLHQKRAGRQRLNTWVKTFVAEGDLEIADREGGKIQQRLKQKHRQEVGIDTSFIELLGASDLEKVSEGDIRQERPKSIRNKIAASEWGNKLTAFINFCELGKDDVDIAIAASTAAAAAKVQQERQDRLESDSYAYTSLGISLVVSICVGYGPVCSLPCYDMPVVFCSL